MARILYALAFVITAGTPAGAETVFRFTEVGDDVVGVLSGTLDVAGLQSNAKTFNGCVDCSFYSGGGAIVGSEDSGQWFDRYLVTGPSFFWSATYSHRGQSVTTAVSEYSGDPFGLFAGQNQIYLPPGYDGSSALNGVLRLKGHDFASLGVEPGSYGYALSFNGDVMDNFTVIFDINAATSVPLPGGLVLLAGALGAFVLRRISTPLRI